MGKMKNEYKILFRKSEWKRPLGRQRHKWKDNVKVDIRDKG